MFSSVFSAIWRSLRVICFGLTGREAFISQRTQGTQRKQGPALCEKYAWLVALFFVDDVFEWLALVVAVELGQEEA
ncbi:MAG TPA: hypothetical protein VGF49_22935, partial [Candidatus Solibacter sp.]